MSGNSKNVAGSVDSRFHRDRHFSDPELQTKLKLEISQIPHHGTVAVICYDKVQDGLRGNESLRSGSE